MLYEVYSDKSAVWSLGFLKHSVQSAIIIRPAEGSFHLPPLSTISFLPSVFRRSASLYGNMVLSIIAYGCNPSLSQDLPQRLAVVSLVQPQSFWLSFPFAYPYPVHSAQDMSLIVVVGLANRKSERIAFRINYEMPFKPLNPMFSRVSCLFFTPLFDFTTLASW